MVRELRGHADQIRQWATLVTPAYEAAGPDDDYKLLLSVLSDVYGVRADEWMDEITSYHADRAKKVFDVRRLRQSSFIVLYCS